MLKNLFTEFPADLPDELIEVICQSDAVRIERIVSRGHVTAPGEWYDQERDEFVLLVSGAAQLVFERQNEPLHLKPGDYLNIPAHTRHRVAWTDPDQETFWLTVHY